MDVTWRELFESEFSMRLTETLLHFVWQGLAIGLMSAAVCRCLHGASASFATPKVRL